jgi:hypothetical protein
MNETNEQGRNKKERQERRETERKATICGAE